MNLLEEVTKHRREIKHETITFSLAELVSMYKTKEIDINPNFQRLFRWSREQQSDFIESLILEIPIPPLFFYEKEDGKWDLLDGLQRLSTIIRYIGSEVEVPKDSQGQAGNESEWHDQNENVISSPLQLLSGEYLKELQGHTYQTLPAQLQLNLKRARMHIYVLKRETHAMYKYEVFKRLNRGGSRLEEQELRNCSVRMLDEKFPEFLQTITKTPDYIVALGLGDEDARNGYLEELALRYFTMKNHLGKFTHDVAKFITNYMEEVARGRIAFDYKAEEELFIKSWSIIKRAFPDGGAFKAKKPDGSNIGPFSPAIFEMVTVGVANNWAALENLTDDQVKEKIVALIASARSQQFTGAGSNSKKKTLGRIELAINTLK
jgi:hypothetical protein